MLFRNYCVDCCCRIGTMLHLYSYADTTSSIGSDVSDIHSSEWCATEDSASSWSFSADDSQSTATFESSSVSDGDFMSSATSDSDDGRSEAPSVGGMDFTREGSSESDDDAEFPSESDVHCDMYDEESNGMPIPMMVKDWIVENAASLYALLSALCIC